MGQISNSQNFSSDHALLVAMKAGDTDALSAFYDRYAPAILALLNRILFNSEEAEELLCDVFLEFWRRAGRYDEQRSSPRSYLMMLARSRAIDRLRCRSTTKLESLQAIPDRASSKPEPPESAQQNEQRQRIEAALKTLSAEQRGALEAAYFDGLSHDEIARKFDKPLGTVKTYIRQAISQLRNCMAKDKPLP
ncbi:MAG TPA: sigma-70 family RNA polymerase sigma factor [Tepidisphaeraceae bacterium]